MKCVDCKKKKGIIQFSSEPIYAVTHGFKGIFICRRCYIKRIEEELKKINKNLKSQKTMLAFEEKQEKVNK